MPTEIRTDHLDQFGWATKTTVTDETGAVLSRTIVYDNGTRFEEIFDRSGPGLSTVTRTFTDVANISSYASKSEMLFLDPVTGATSEIDPVTEQEVHYILLETQVNDDGTTVTRDHEADTIVRTDPNNAKSWSRIEEENAIYGDGGNFQRTTYYDDGTRVVERTGALFKRKETFDVTGNLLTETHTSYNLDGQLVNIQSATYVGGEVYTSTIQHYEDGVQTAVTEAVANTHPSPWSQRTTYLDESGQTTNRLTDFKDGVQRWETYSEDQLVRQEDTDANDTKPWSSIVTTLDADGSGTTRMTTFDDGLVRTDMLLNGELVSREEDDPNAWPRVEETLDAEGNVVTRVTRYENGNTLEETYESGEKQIVLTDVDPSTEIETRTSSYFIDGFDSSSFEMLYYEIAIYDDGRRETIGFEGEGYGRVVEDLADAYDWRRYDETTIAYESIGHLYGPDFVVAWNRIDDDGSSERWSTTRRHVEDVAGTNYFEKLNAAGELTLYEQRETDALGRTRHIETQTLNEDGSYSEFHDYFDYSGADLTYQARFHVTQDDTPWEIQQKFYSVDSDFISVATTFWDGRKRTDDFENGVKTARLDEDLGDVKSWEEILTRYYDDGSISERKVTNDDGVITTDFFDGGQRLAREKVDTLDAKVWDKVLQTYQADGTLMETETILDDGDIIVHLAEENAKVHYDGNDSSGWLFKVTEYAEDDSRSVTTYDTLQETPTIYSGLFDLA